MTKLNRHLERPLKRTLRKFLAHVEWRLALQTCHIFFRRHWR